MRTAIVVMAVLAMGGAWGAETGWRAGAARADITPEHPMWMAGYASRTTEAQGTLLPICAKALALEDGAGNRALVITTDLLGFPKAMSVALRGKIQERYGLSPAQILLNSSHTHSGPVLRDSLYAIYPIKDPDIEKIDAYSVRLEQQIVDLAGAALDALQPARLSSGNGTARFAANRRNNKEAEILQQNEFKGPVDHSVPVLKVEGQDGALVAVLFGYACHATTLDICQWSGDYPGFAQAAIEAAHPGACALFCAGCGSDQNPLPRRSIALARQYGRDLASAVERTLEEPMTPLEPVLATAYTEIELGLEPAPSHEVLATMAERTDWTGRAAQRLLAVLEAGKPLPATRPYPVQVWRLGNQPLVALGGEVVVDYAIAVKRLLGSGTFVYGYSNDLPGYIPSKRVLHEGGYEGDTSQLAYELPAKWQPGIEEKIMSTVASLATQAGLIAAK